jgi:hypothetical protein
LLDPRSGSDHLLSYTGRTVDDGASGSVPLSTTAFVGAILMPATHIDERVLVHPLDRRSFSSLSNDYFPSQRIRFLLRYVAALEKNLRITVGVGIAEGRRSFCNEPVVKTDTSADATT